MGKMPLFRPFGTSLDVVILRVEGPTMSLALEGRRGVGIRDGQGLC